jgi:flavin reductase (DIM6/NTAB) family NADH-FMN oxidoreductase RutF
VLQNRFLADSTSDEFRTVVGHFLSGVTVITVSHGGKLYGTTASAFSSLSLEPPMVLICLNRGSDTGAAVLAAGGFAVNVLAAGQEELALRFGRKGDDKFDGLALDAEAVEGPLLPGALATLECRVVEHTIGGTHRVFIAQVRRAAARTGAPLAYYRGRFGRLEPLTS